MSRSAPPRLEASVATSDGVIVQSRRCTLAGHQGQDGGRLEFESAPAAVSTGLNHGVAMTDGASPERSRSAARPRRRIVTADRGVAGRAPADGGWPRRFRSRLDYRSRESKVIRRGLRPPIRSEEGSERLEVLQELMAFVLAELGPEVMAIVPIARDPLALGVLDVEL